METKVIEKKKDRVKVEFLGADHGLMNLIRVKVAEDKSVEFVTYSRPHPLLEGFVLTVKGSNPESSIKKALAAVKTEAKEIKAAFKSAK